MSRKSAAKRRALWIELAIAVAALVALALAWRFTPLSELLTRDNALEWSRVARKTWWAPAAVVLAYTPAAFFMFPRPFLTLLTIMAFGRWFGAAYSGTGIMLAAMATYYAGRLLRRDTVLRMAGGTIDEVSRVVKKHGVMAVFVSNQLPVPPFAVQGMICGAIGMRAWQYALGSLLGMAPGLIAATLFFGELRAALDDPSAFSWWMLGAVAVGFAAVIWLARHWFARRVGR
jgi:uncharacterized membrane protein YdjX (TVP38/TMEM64 family)